MRSIDAWQEADSDTALTYIRRAIGLLEAEDNTLQLARAHVVAGRMLTLDARDDEADVHLQRARRLFAVGGTPVDLGILCAEEAKVAAGRGEAQTALALAKQAAERLGDDVRYRANVSHAYAVAHFASGDPVEAEKHYRQALDALSDAHQWREAAQVARELSQLLRTLNREAEAYDLIDHASLLMLRHVGGIRRPARDRAR